MIQTQSYHIQNLLGQGGMAKVYLAEHKTLGHKVAIKVLNKEFVHNENIRKRFLAEARNLARMSHPHVVRVMDLIEEGDMVAFVMEHIDGQTLRDYLDQKGKLPNDEIKKLFGQMLEAVGYVHEQGLLHRDIKPSNFMLDSRGSIKLLDFGIAKTMDASSAEYTQTATSQHMGTPMYMSPEQVKSTKDVTAQSDIYSLGVVLWQMAAGRKPYDTNTLSTFEIQVKIVNEALPGTGTMWDNLIKLATDREANKRYLKFDFPNFQNNRIEGLELTQLEQYKRDSKTPKETIKTKSICLLNNTNRADYLVRTFWMLFVVICISNFSILTHIGSFGSGFKFEKESYAAIEANLGLVKFGFLITCIVLFIKWQMRACKNLNQVVPKTKFKFDSYDAWTWWFVPVWALWMPFKVIKNLFIGLSNILEKPANGMGFLRWWWFLWILGLVFQRFSYVEISGIVEENVNKPIPVDGFILPFLAQWLDLIAIPLTINVVKRISNLESELFMKYQNNPKAF